jgi:transcription initiation factor IIF auxiliary subunit
MHHTVTTSPPFKISEEGWGEFDMEIICTGIDKGGDHSILHDLNFQDTRYEAKHIIVSAVRLYRRRDCIIMGTLDLQESKARTSERAEGERNGARG